MFIKCLTVGPIGTNCYIACDRTTDRAVVIDPGSEAARVTAALAETGCKADYVVLTHGHADHMGAAREVLAATGAKLALLADELPLLNGPQNLWGDIYSGAEFKPLSPDILLHDGDTVALGALQLKALHTPGHTAGSCCLLAPDALFSGDTLFSGGAGRTDLPTGSSSDLLRSLRRLFALEGDLQVFPGHGAFTTLARERAENPYAGALSGGEDYQ